MGPLLSVSHSTDSGGSCKYPAVAAASHVAAVETPVGCSCPRLSPQPPLQSPLYSSDWLEPRKTRMGPQACPPLRPSPFHVLTSFCLASHPGLSNPRDPLLLLSPERVLTPEALGPYHISVPMQNYRTLHPQQFPSPCYFLLFCTLRMGAHLWPLQCLVLAAETIRRMINLCGLAQSYRKLELWHTAFRRDSGPVDLGWNLISYLLELVQVQRWTMDTSGEGQPPSPKRVVVCSLEKPGWDVTHENHEEW